MTKELYIAAHEELIEEFLCNHPDADYWEAYDKCAGPANDRYVDKLADMADTMRQRAKDERQC